MVVCALSDCFGSLTFFSMILQDVLNMIPQEWDPVDYSNSPYCIVPVPEFSKEFSDIMARFQGNYYHSLTGLFRVQNPFLWAKFMLKIQDYEKRGAIQIIPSYHDTNASNIESICEYNIDWRMGLRFMFGPGVYFSKSPDNAFKHSSKYNGPLRAMFLVDILTQNIQEGDDNIVLPDPGYDTVIAHQGQTYVKYFDGEYYPRYFITYEAWHTIS